MNWREHPHLFANGKFKALFKGERGIQHEIIHYEWDDEQYLLEDPTITEDPMDRAWAFTSDCTLIARKIEDMTDEEVIKQFPNTDPISLSDAVTKDSSMMFADDLLYLLSIGVYPFNQSHFEDGTIIDVKTLRETE